LHISEIFRKANAKLNKNRIYIGDEYDRWMEIKTAFHLEANSEVANIIYVSIYIPLFSIQTTIENIQREALTPLEEAKALRQLIEDFKMTHEEISHVVGRSRSSVSNLIRLLQLGDNAKQLLSNGDIEMGHGRALLPLSNEQQFEVGNQVVQKSLSVRWGFVPEEYIIGRAFYIWAHGDIGGLFSNPIKALKTFTFSRNGVID
jgi:plasmid maintenance system antidote protein VapI